MSNNHTAIHHIIDKHKKEEEESSTVRTKEGEPIQASSESHTNKTFEIQESEPRIEDKEVEKFIQIHNDDPTIELDPKLQKAGLEVIDTSSLDPRHNITLPISDEKVVEGLDQPINSSWRWLAELAQFMLKQGHISLKKIHGHVVRVIKK